MTRIEKLWDLLSENKWDGLIVDAPTDLYYLTGISLSAGRLLIEPSKATLFVDGRYFEACQKAVSFPVFLTKGYLKDSGFAQQAALENKKIAFDSASTPYHVYEELSETFKSTKWTPTPQPIRLQRQKKDQEEIEKLKESARLVTQGMEFAKSQLREGISEIEVARALEIFWIEKGGEGLSFSPIIAFGKNGAFPHYRAGDVGLQKGDSVLIDIGVCKNHYHSDITRVFSFGAPSERIKEIYKVVFQAQKSALAMCRPGVALSALDEVAREVIIRAGYGDFYPHSLGHGVGLEIHELPVVRKEGSSPLKTLSAGMVITVEPGIYVPEKGGVRLEDTIAITDSGFEILTNYPLPSAIPII